MNDEEIEDALQRQDEALALLERLRIAEPAVPNIDGHAGGGRRESRRWPAPKGISIDMHDGNRWQPAPCSDLGIGGLRLTSVPGWLQGPVPVRLKGAGGPAILALGDLMWRDGVSGAGMRLEFQDPEERDQWTATLIDSLLARYALA